jgi:signal transduction histidine kinase/DNA-binding response OmpR family regulator
MKLHDLSISTRLHLGLGAILLLVVLLGVVAWFEAERLWQKTQGIYEHPLIVRGAVGELKADILAMQRGMKEVILSKDEPERQSCLEGIDTSEGDAHRQLGILWERYLGPRQDIERIQSALTQWKAIREESIRLVRAGRLAEVISRGKPTGIGRSQADLILKEIEDVSSFSHARADKFNRDARAGRDNLLLRLGVLLAVILLLSSAISHFLLKGINGPLKELAAVTAQYKQGNMAARSRHVSADELGLLAASFNELAAGLQAEMQRKEQINRIAGVMLQEEDLRSFCQELLKALLEHTGSQVGAVYLLNERKTDFEHFESIGLGGRGRASFSAMGLEGEFGAALTMRQIQRVTDIPADTRFTFAAVSGDFLPRELITIPVVSETEVAGLISLASVRSYPAEAIQLVNDLWSVMTARLNGVLVFRQVHEFSRKLELQNRELEAQKKELAAQAAELSEQNVELEMQKKELDEASRLKSAFLSNMSHELRTPLNSVIALSGVLNRRLRGAVPAEEHGYLEIIERNGKQLLALINDILDLSRIEAGKEDLSLSHFSIQELAGEVAATLEPQAREKNIALRNLVGADLPALHSDFTKCRHILQNIVANAVKFTEQGQVEIAAEPVDNSIRLTVTDTGIGIAPEQIPHIFDEFRQADESTSRKYGGAGLGLAIARKYASLLRGRITVESSPGKGSRFAVTLPLTLAPPAPGESEACGGTLASAAEKAPARPGGMSREHPFAAAYATATNRNPVILLVEDSEPAVIQIEDILAGQGYQIRVARNGQEALDRIEQTPPDAIILDLMMPGVDGFQVLRAVRGAEKTAHLPVLILTAKQITREELSLLKGSQVQQLIAKGDISKAELLAAVANMVSSAGMAGLHAGLDAKAAQPHRPAQSAASPSRKPVILIVEDNADNLKTVRALLEDSATILEASNGQTGLEQAQARQPDVILLDIGLPVMDGFKTLEAMRHEETLRHIPVIAVTARAMKGDREQVLGRGFDGYVSKPVDEQVLKETIRKVLYGN